MLYAKKNNEKIRAKPNKTASCPYCEKEMIPKCGDIKIWHWAHKHNQTCDYSNKVETYWHLKWKKMVKEKNCEVRTEKKDELKIADIKNDSEKVIELQHSPISIREMRKRENHYDDMIWLFDMNERYDNFHFKIRGEDSKNQYVTFNWKWPWEKIKNIKYRSPIFFDFSNHLMNYDNWSELDYELKRFKNYPFSSYQRKCIFQIKKIHNSGRGWGIVFKKNKFILKYMKNILQDRLKEELKENML